MLFSSVSFNAGESIQVQIGDSGGLETTGYATGSSSFSAGVVTAVYTNAFRHRLAALAAQGVDGSVILDLQDSTTNTWIATSIITNNVDTTGHFSGSKSLSATLDRLSITGAAGSTFDGGKINISWSF